MKRAAVAFLVVVVCATSLVAAVADHQGIVAGFSGGCHFEIMSSYAEWFLPFGEANGSAVAQSPTGRVRAIVQGNGGFHLEEIEPGASQRISVTVPGWVGVQLVVDRAGRTHVLAVTSDRVDNAIISFDAAGTVAGIQNIGPGYADLGSGDVTGFDLAADQCTLFLSTTTAIRRFNACAGLFLTDFALLTHPASTRVSLRVMPDGGLLVGYVDRVDQFSAAGTVVRTYAVRGRGAMGIVNNGAAVWLAPRCQNRIEELDLQTGATRLLVEDSFFIPLSIVPYLSWTAALGSAHTPTVPTAGEWALALLATAVVAAALLRIR
jgi:hypothetical protein